MKLPIKVLPHALDLPLPQYATEHSAGLDLLAATDEILIITPGQKQLVPTGISIAIPQGFEGQIRSRSGLSLKNGVVVLNSPGTIDSDYRGEIKVILYNTGNSDFNIERGMRIAQLVISSYQRVEWSVVDELGTSIRDEGGFGSTGL